MKRRLRHLVGCVLALAPFLASAAPETEQIAAYLGASERLQHVTNSIVTRMAPTNPQVADVLRRSLAYLDKGDGQP
jgi:hypothetical protein